MLMLQLNTLQIPLDQVHKYLELLNRQQDEDERHSKESSATDSTSVVSVSSSVTSTSAAVVSLSSSVAVTEKTDVSPSPASDSRYVATGLFVLLHTATVSTCYLLFILPQQPWSYIHRFYFLVNYFHILSIIKTLNGTE